MRRLFLAACLTLAGLPAGPALAHPHVTVDFETQVQHDRSGQVMALRHVWTFDDMYTAFATQGLDRDGNGTLSREELADLTKVNVDHLGERGFFTVFRHDRRHVSFGPPQDAWSEVVGGKLKLHFTVPLRTPFRAAGRPLTLQIYDPEFFVAFVPAEGEPLRLADAPAGCGLDYQPPRRADARSVNLSEAFFQALSPNSNFGEQFSGRFTVTCQ